MHYQPQHGPEPVVCLTQASQYRQQQPVAETLAETLALSLSINYCIPKGMSHPQQVIQHTRDARQYGAGILMRSV